MKEEKLLKDSKKKKQEKLIAKKDFLIVHNEFRFDIKKGDEIIVPEKFLANLKTEKVI